MYLGVDLFGLIWFGTACFLDICFLPQVGDVFNHYFFKQGLCPHSPWGRCNMNQCCPRGLLDSPPFRNFPSPSPFSLGDFQGAELLLCVIWSTADPF